jgi:hypothetical protein
MAIVLIGHGTLQSFEFQNVLFESVLHAFGNIKGEKMAGLYCEWVIILKCESAAALMRRRT